MRSHPLITAALLVLATSGTTASVQAETDTPPTVDLSGPFLSGEFWKLDPEAVPASLDGAGLQWTSAARTSARSLKPGQRFGDARVIESAVWTEDGAPAKAGFLLYSRGDTGGLSQEEFARLIQETKSTLSETLDSKPRQETLRGPATIEQLIWNSQGSTFTLEWSETREVKSRGIPYRAEFLRLIATPPARETSLVERALSQRDERLADTEVRKKPARLPNGDVLLEDIPMIDQGPKGYCVVASAERVLRYFGRDADQHQLAQMANSSADRGTSPKAMVDALDDLSSRLKFRVSEEYALTVRDVEEMLRRYNRHAGRENLPEIKLPDGLIDLGMLYLSMDGPTLREARTSQRSDLGRFSRDVQRAIDEGRPLLWSVMLGVIPEPEIPQAAGGHMRLIIGYNEETDEILYSDSWGKGHELKRMDTGDAWTITTSLHSLITR